MSSNLRTLLRGGLTVALAAGFLVFGNVPSAKAEQILQYVERGYAATTRPLLVDDDGSNTFFSDQSIAVSITLAGVNGSINGFVTYLGVNSNQYLQSSDIAFSGGKPSKTSYEQDFVGQILLTSGINGTGVNYLTVTFSDINNAAEFKSGKGSTTAGLTHSSTDRTILSFTSDVMSFVPTGNEDFSIAINNIRNPPGADPSKNLGVQLDGSTIQSFDGNQTGTFSAVRGAVPEPTSIIGAAIAGCVMIGLRVRRRNVAA